MLHFVEFYSIIIVDSKKFERMDHFMAIIIRHSTQYVNTTLVNPDIVVDYDNESDRFYVTFVETGSGYIVDRKDFVSEDFKYTDRIEEGIISGFCTEDEDPIVLFSGKASNEVYMIWMANCDIF